MTTKAQKQSNLVGFSVFYYQSRDSDEVVGWFREYRKRPESVLKQKSLLRNGGLDKCIEMVASVIIFAYVACMSF